MYYKIEISKSAEKFLLKLKKSYKKQVIGFVGKLEDYPVPRNKKHILELAGNCMLCEYDIDKFRIYYTIENQFVVIENIKYLGHIDILKGFSNHKSGNKKYPNQQRDIKKIKKEFKTKYS